MVLLAAHIETPYVELERGFGHELRGQLDVFQSATRYRVRPTHVHEIGPCIAEAFARAQSGRPRPVLVQIPQDVLNGSPILSNDLNGSLNNNAILNNLLQRSNIALLNNVQVVAVNLGTGQVFLMPAV